MKVNTIRIFKSTIRAMGQPKFIRLLVNQEGTKLIVQRYYKKTFNSFRIPENFADRDSRVEIHSKAFCRLLAGRTKWDREASYRIMGSVYEKQGIAVFDLTRAEMISEKDEKNDEFCSLSS